MVSAGISKYLAILLAIRTSPAGVVLIDEIDHGFHYSTMQKLLSSLLDEAARNETQIVMSTHSQECLAALAPSMKSRTEDFCLLRAKRLSDGTCNVTSSVGQSLEAAIEQDVEIR